jgi:hypothetical protein
VGRKIGPGGDLFGAAPTIIAGHAFMQNLRHGQVDRAPRDSTTQRPWRSRTLSPSVRLRDPWAVVDSVGAVKGVSGLRVADASIIPEVPSATTNVTVIMLAERLIGASTPADSFSRVGTLRVPITSGRSPAVPRPRCPTQ